MKYRLSKKQVFSHRPKPFYFLTTCEKDEYTREKVRANLEELIDCGFGGFILFNKPPKGFDKEKYLSEDWFNMVKLFCEEAKKLKLEMWINDGHDYPPGGVAGKVYDIDPDIPQLRILLEDGKLAVKPVDWGYPAFENFRSGELFNQLVHEQYKKHIGEFFGDPIKGFFTDGDNRRVIPGAMLNPNHPARDYFPWSNDFEESFKDTYGYDIMPHMVDVINRKDCIEAENYWEHAGHLYQRWFNNNAKWCHKHGLLYTGHTGDTAPYAYKEAPRSSTLTEGRFSDIQSIFDFPGTDQELLALDGGKHMVAHNWYCPKAIWGNQIHTERMTGYSDVSQDPRAKQAGSTAFIYNRKEVMCEMFAASNYNVSPAELKQIAAFQIMQGVTFVVPHAFHYRYFGQTKYFAPPEFSTKGMIGEFVYDLNTELAELTYMMAEGKTIAPIALIDPTVASWRNTIDIDEYFKAFSNLNRMPQGFVICDIDKIVEKNLDFKVAVVAGFKPEQKDLDKLTAKGIKIIGVDELDKISELVDCPVKYVGEGTPHFLRKNINGEEFTFISNIENEGPISGKIFAYGKEKDIILYQGDIRYISAKHDDIPAIKNHGEKIFAIPEIVKVDFASANRIALERFIYNGDAVAKIEDTPAISFPFDTSCEITGAKLYMPIEATDKCTSIKLDSTDLVGEKCMVFDDPYMCYNLPALSIGSHSLDIERTGAFNFWDVCYIEGDFNVDITSDKTEYKAIFHQYNLSVYIPQNATVSLSKRTAELKTNLSWALQGQPFYSGKATYSFSADIPAKGEYRLVLPKVRDVVYVKVNGKCQGKLIRDPYEIEFKCKKGINKIEITVVNSFANAMEFYLEDSGILEGGYIEKI